MAGLNGGHSLNWFKPAQTGGCLRRLHDFDRTEGQPYLRTPTVLAGPGFVVFPAMEVFFPGEWKTWAHFQQENEVCHKVYLAWPSQSGPFDEAE